MQATIHGVAKSGARPSVYIYTYILHSVYVYTLHTYVLSDFYIIVF